MNYFPFLVNPPQYLAENSYFNFNLPQKYDKFNETLTQKIIKLNFSNNKMKN